MRKIDLDSLNINKYTNKELLLDYINRWGNAQICDSCGWVSPYGLYSHRLSCCGKVTRLVLEQEDEVKETTMDKWDTLKEQLEKLGRTQNVFAGHILMMMEILEKNSSWDLKRDGMKQEYLK